MSWNQIGFLLWVLVAVTAFAMLTGIL